MKGFLESICEICGGHHRCIPCINHARCNGARCALCIPRDHAAFQTQKSLEQVYKVPYFCELCCELGWDAAGGSKRAAHAAAGSIQAEQKTRPAKGQQHEERPRKQPPPVAVEVPIPAAKRQKVQQPQPPPPVNRSGSPANSAAAPPAQGSARPAVPAAPLAPAVDKAAEDRKRKERPRVEPSVPTTTQALGAAAGPDAAAKAAAAATTAGALHSTAHLGNKKSNASGSKLNGPTKQPVVTGAAGGHNSKAPVKVLAAGGQSSKARAPPSAPAAPPAKKARTQEAAPGPSVKAAPAVATMRDASGSKPSSIKRAADPGDHAEQKYVKPKHVQQRPDKDKLPHAASMPPSIPSKMEGAHGTGLVPKGKPAHAQQQDPSSSNDGQQEGLQRATSLPHALQAARGGVTKRTSLIAPVKAPAAKPKEELTLDFVAPDNKEPVTFLLDAAKDCADLPLPPDLQSLRQQPGACIWDVVALDPAMARAALHARVRFYLRLRPSLRGGHARAKAFMDERIREMTQGAQRMRYLVASSGGVTAYFALVDASDVTSMYNPDAPSIVDFEEEEHVNKPCEDRLGFIEVKDPTGAMGIAPTWRRNSQPAKSALKGVESAQPFMASDEEMGGAFHGGDDLADDFLFADNTYDPYHDVSNVLPVDPPPAAPITAAMFDDPELQPVMHEPVLPEPPIMEAPKDPRRRTKQHVAAPPTGGVPRASASPTLVHTCLGEYVTRHGPGVLLPSSPGVAPLVVLPFCDDDDKEAMTAATDELRSTGAHVLPMASTPEEVEAQLPHATALAVLHEREVPLLSEGNSLPVRHLLWQGARVLGLGAPSREADAKATRELYPHGVTLIMDPSVARTAPESLARMGTAFQAAHSACQSKRGRWGMYARPEVAANHQDIGVAALPDAYRATIRRNHAVPLPVRDALKVIHNWREETRFVVLVVANDGDMAAAPINEAEERRRTIVDANTRMTIFVGTVEEVTNFLAHVQELASHA